MRTLLNTSALLALLASLASAGDVAPRHLIPIPVQQVTIDDDFWSPKRRVWQEVTISDAFDKFEKDGAIRNYDRIRDGARDGHEGPPFLDGLLCETIRGASDFLLSNPNSALEKRLDGYIDHIAAAQARDPEGYINTYTQLAEPGHRWGLNGGNDVIQHDVYNAGCVIEAAVHYYQATGKTKLLEVAARLANHMCDVMGPPPKNNVIPGHAISEEAATKLYLLFRSQPGLKEKMLFVVEEDRYLKLASFWIENRGNHKNRQDFGNFAGAYDQDHMPVLEQPTIEGHAVRATLMCAGLSALAAVNDREDYRQASERLWQSLTGRKMYITGGAGATAEYEAFAPDYVLPNDGYLETCAAVGAAFFSRNMNLLCADARYADEMERVLYNGALCAVSVKGNTYYYQNPLDVKKPLERWSWHGCPCCPPMFLKIMGAMPGYIYAQDPSGLYVNLFVGSRAEAQLPGGKVVLRQTTRYPWQGDVKIVVEPENSTAFDLHIRIPGWCQGKSSTDDLYQIAGRPEHGGARFKINGKTIQNPEIVRGYARLNRKWKSGDTVELTLDMPVRRVKANPRVEADIDRVALMRGPIVYCVEGIDNPEGMRNLFLSKEAAFTSEHRDDLLGGVTLVRGTVQGEYRNTDGSVETKSAEMVAIPYYVNSNRKPSQMMVWLPETPGLAQSQPVPTIASRAQPQASHCWPADSLAGMNDQIEPSASDDTRIPRFTWWDHWGTREWVQYDFDKPQKISAVDVYWWDERRIQAHCRVPQSWQLLYKDGEQWKPVSGTTEYGVKMDQYNHVGFAPVTSTSLRIEVQLQPDWSGGILEWRVE
jgi:DUF1680 family protein